MGSRFGRRPLPVEDALTEHLDIRVSPRQLADLKEACATLGIDLSTATREALNEWAGDFQERRIFDRRQREAPVTVERRRGERRRVHRVHLAPAPQTLST